jgi:signal transduction histidine kinase
VNRLRHLLYTVTAALPLLVLVLLSLDELTSGAVGTAVVLWIVGVAVFAGAVWRETVMPMDELKADLGTTSGQHTRWRVRELMEQARTCESRATDLARLLRDVAAGLGEGLMVVSPELRVKLVNAQARQFLGVEKIEDEPHLLDVLRTPEVVDAIRNAASGRVVARTMFENPRGVWEIRPCPLRQGGAVVVISEVGLLRRAAELRQRFVQDLSHELRSPLAVMRTAVEAMEGEVSPQLAEMMVRQVDRITRLTDELYELATIEAGQVDLRPEDQFVAPMVAEVVNDFASVAEQSGVELRMEIDDDLEATFDRRGLYRVLANLVDNAIKYNRRGGWVELRGWSTDVEVAIEVADSGQGIPASELRAVMQRFYRVDRARTPGAGGLGLGLAIVKHMVQQMGGNLTLDSREEVGTQVTVTLPRNPVPSDDPESV